jgi:hypothetical protein
MPLASPHSSASRSETFNVSNPLVCKKLCDGNRFWFRCFGNTEYTELELLGATLGSKMTRPRHCLRQSATAQLSSPWPGPELSFPRWWPGPAAGWGSRPGWDTPGGTRRTSVRPRLASERAAFCTPGKPKFPATLARSCEKINAEDAETQRKKKPPKNPPRIFTDCTDKNSTWQSRKSGIAKDLKSLKNRSIYRCHPRKPAAVFFLPSSVSSASSAFKVLR